MLVMPCRLGEARSNGIVGCDRVSCECYHRAEAETEHHATSSGEGCLLLVISSPLNEMLR